jgi:hypothetical protein
MRFAKKKRWFWASIVIATCPRKRLDGACEIWKNLHLIEAAGSSEAYAKALMLGQANAGDCNGSLRLNGKPAVAKFAGIEQMGLVYDELVDGAEIMWTRTRKTMSQLPRPPSRRKIISRLDDALKKNPKIHPAVQPWDV